MADFTCYTGDTLKLRLQVYTNAAQTARKNITGMGVAFHAADSTTDPGLVLDKAVGSGVVLTQPETGSIEITLTPTDTNGLGASGGVVLYYIRLTEGTDVYTLATGKITLKRLPV